MAATHIQSDGRPWTSKSLYARIVAKHSPPEWVVFGEVHDATGSMRNRRADAVAMNLWPSRGMELRGFEIKVSRSDLRRELSDPSKAEAVASYCDTWWVVTPPGLVDSPADLPAAWGLLEADDKGGLRTMRAATPTEARPVTRAFLGAMLRAAQQQVAEIRADYVPRDGIAEEIQRAEARGRAEIPTRMGHLEREYAALQADVKAFSVATGIPLAQESAWRRADVPAIARAYRLGLALAGEHGIQVGTLANSLRGAANLLKLISEGLEPLLAAEAGTRNPPTDDAVAEK